MKTFKMWEASQSTIPQTIVEHFEAHQVELKHLIKNSVDLMGKCIIIASPANKNIVSSLETAFDIIVAHEKRHFAQAREVNKLMIKNKFDNQNL